MSAAHLTGRWWLRPNAAGELVLTVEEHDAGRYSYERDHKIRDGTLSDVVQLGRMGCLGKMDGIDERMTGLETRVSELEMRPRERA